MKKTVTKILGLVMALCCMASVFAVSASAGPILANAVAQATIKTQQQTVQELDKLNDQIKYTTIEKPAQEAKDAVNDAKNDAKNRVNEKIQDAVDAPFDAANHVTNEIHDTVSNAVRL